VMGKRYSKGIAVVVVLLIVAVAGVAFAGSKPRSDKPVRTNLYQDFVARFAANLGVDQAKVTEAIEATKKQILDEAVANGELTREQADKMAAMKSGEFGIGGIHVKKLRPDNRGDKFNFMGKDMEKILGITHDQFKEELKSGKSFETILSDHGMTVEQYHQKMLESRKEALDKALAEGKITQDQYDKMTKRVNQKK